MNFKCRVQGELTLLVQGPDQKEQHQAPERCTSEKSNGAQAAHTNNWTIISHKWEADSLISVRSLGTCRFSQEHGRSPKITRGPRG